MSSLDPSTQVRNGAFIEAAMAASALVATAGGPVSFEHRHKVDEILENLTAFAAFSYHAALVHFEAYAQEICKNAEEGKAKALSTIAALADDNGDGRIVLRIACAVAQNDGPSSPETAACVREIARTLGQALPRLETGDRPTTNGAGRNAICIALGNQKGGTGKSTTAVHLAVGLLKRGFQVGCIDLDGEQGTFAHYLENRRAYAETADVEVAMPLFRRVAPSRAPDQRAAESEDRRNLAEAFDRFADLDYLIVDTPGNKGHLSRLGHSNADALITPLNDSFLDIDVLAEIDLDERRVLAPSAYAQMVMSQNQQRDEHGQRPVDWFVMRNRLAQLDTRNSRDMRRLLDRLAERMGFELLPGLSERMIFRELFYKGLTLLDLPEAPDEARLNASRWNARQEIGRLLDAVTARCPTERSAVHAPQVAETDAAAPAPEEDDTPPPEAEDPFLMLKEAMSQ